LLVSLDFVGCLAMTDLWPYGGLKDAGVRRIRFSNPPQTEPVSLMMFRFFRAWAFGLVGVAGNGGWFGMADCRCRSESALRTWLV